MPTGWTGRFWPRTECDFNAWFGSDPGYKDCTSDAQCDTSHVCYGGKCMLNCTSTGTRFCQGASGLNNSSAICAPAGTVDVCTYPQGTVCKTGDCQGLYQCYGTWGDLSATQGGAAPATLVEPTSNGTTDVNYDVSMVSGYNVQTAVQPSVPASGANCYAPSCTSDLNASCPANLQVTEAPTSVSGPIPCGNGTFCQSGACVNNVCVIGCNDPIDQCQTANPPAGLDCTALVPGGNGAEYEDMYSSSNLSQQSPTTAVHSMSSGNQGTATCWGTADCAPGETCATGLVSNFPSGVGLCVSGGLPVSAINCKTQSDVGNPCGGYTTPMYPNALGYTCVSTGSGTNDVACVPAYNPPVSGLGTLESPSGLTPLFTGEASLMNPAWMTAALQAGGGTTPFYKTFGAACPHEYAWSYDDYAGGLDCNSGSGGAQVNFTVTFGP